MTHLKYDSLNTNAFYLTNNIMINLLIIGKEIIKIKRIAIYTVRFVEKKLNHSKAQIKS